MIPENATLCIPIEFKGITHALWWMDQGEPRRDISERAGEQLRLFQKIVGKESTVHSEFVGEATERASEVGPETYFVLHMTHYETVVYGSEHRATQQRIADKLKSSGEADVIYQDETTEEGEAK